LKTDMAGNSAAQKSATNVRTKASVAFTAEESDLKQAIGQMDEAVKVLSAIGADQTMAKSADHEKFMAGSKVKGPLLMAVGTEVKNALAAASVFLSADQNKQVASFMQAPFTGTYSAQSGSIVGILKDMRDTFKVNLADSTATETKDKAAHDKFMTVQKEAFASMEKVYKEKQDTLASNDEALTSKKKQLQAATKDKADAEDFLEKLTDMCAKKAKEYDERTLLSANEQAAVAEAISILNSDSAFETFGTVSATSTGAVKLLQKKTSFLQLGSGRSESALRRELQHLLGSGKSARLARVLGAVEAGNPFQKVLIEIEKMKKLSVEEGKADKKNLDWCKDERTNNGKNLDDRKAEILTLTGDIDKLTATINDPVKGLKQQITGAETSLVQNNDDQVSQTKQRAEENVAYQADVANLVAAEELLDKAIAVLSAYYDGLAKKIAGSEFLQADPAPPKTWDSDSKEGGTSYDGQSKAGGDAVTMLKFSMTETQKEEMQAHTDEEKGQAGFEDSMTALKKDQATLEGSLIKLNEDLATAEKTLIEKTEDLKDTEVAKAKIEDYLLQIKPGCDFITTNFVLREKNRATETAALTKAVTLIKATPAFKVAVQTAKEEGFGKCKSLCVASEAGAKCKACQAGVTVPGYCAGHKATPGC